MLTDLLIIKRVINRVKSFWPYFLMILVIDLLVTPLSLLIPIPLKIVIDNVIGNAPLSIVNRILPLNFGAINTTTLLVFAISLQIGVVFFIQLQSLVSYALRTHLGERLTLELRSQLLHQAQRLSLMFHDMKGTADSIYRIQYDAPAVQWFSIYGLLPLITNAVLLISMVVVIVRLNVQLSIVALAILPLLLLYARFYNLRMRPRYKIIKQVESNTLKIVQEILTGIRIVKVFGREAHEQARFLAESNRNVSAKTKLALAEGGFSLAVNVTTGVGAAVILFWGAIHVQAGELSIGELIMVMTYLTQLYSPVKSISNQFKLTQSAMTGLQRAFELLDEPPEIIEAKNTLPLDRAVGAIRFYNVGFAYHQDAPVLRNVSFEVAPGTRVGIQGPTGSGKSTLMSLLCRLYDPQEGQIWLDGKDIRSYSLDDYRRQFAIMLQEPMLFATSIAENIGYARPDWDFAAIEQAARAANAHEFILSLPQGYQTLVGERGMCLSGGERQRISLARAFLKDAPILILDEPTSSIDHKTEGIIMEGLDQLMQGRTTFIIAHRLNTLTSCDQHLFLQPGGQIQLAN